MSALLSSPSSCKLKTWHESRTSKTIILVQDVCVASAHCHGWDVWCLYNHRLLSPGIPKLSRMLYGAGEIVLIGQSSSHFPLHVFSKILKFPSTRKLSIHVSSLTTTQWGAPMSWRGAVCSVDDLGWTQAITWCFLLEGGPSGYLSGHFSRCHLRDLQGITLVY